MAISRCTVVISILLLFIASCAYPIRTGILPTAKVGETYTAVVRIEGDNGPYSVELFEGELPAGLSIDNAGVVTGTALGPVGRYRFTLKVTDSADPPVVLKPHVVIHVQQRLSGDAKTGQGYSKAVHVNDCKNKEGTKSLIFNDKQNFLSALSNASSGDVICIEDGAVITFNADRDIVIPAGVTIASFRGTEDKVNGGYRLGGLIKDIDPSPHTLFILENTDPEASVTRITGLRVEGPSAYYEPAYEIRDNIRYLLCPTDYNGTQFLATLGGPVEIDNLEGSEGTRKRIPLTRLVRSNGLTEYVPLPPDRIMRRTNPDRKAAINAIA